MVKNIDFRYNQLYRDKNIRYIWKMYLNRNHIYVHYLLDKNKYCFNYLQIVIDTQWIY